MVIDMSIGSSGRIVIEIDPDFKQDLYKTLKKEGISLKQWFLEGAEKFVSERASTSPAVDANAGGIENDI